jgi:hypothetical protein
MLISVPGGLDKSWEACRLEGLEMLQHSVEQRRERRGQPDSASNEHQMMMAGTGVQMGMIRDRSKSRSESNRCQHRVQPAEPVKLPVRCFMCLYSYLMFAVCACMVAID